MSYMFGPNHFLAEIHFDSSPLQYGTAVAQWLRCYATNLRVAGSKPDGVIGIFH